MIELKRVVPFALAGTVAFFVDAGMLVLSAPFIGAFWGRVVSFLTSLTTTWLINRNFTFKDRNPGVGMGREFARYGLAMLPGAGANWLAYGVVATLVPHTALGLTLAVAAGSLSGLISNFLAADKLVYKKNR